ncbi:hypothetical protein J8F10_35230 [Gemmata sp. G18]|uniref:TIGR03067 domain-containing protein n=1 Tax=Gemmata palustris TaxID=2822762 RepID=A0ABS5C5Y3_9BACT|nr:hypothetical protein [Gemmata palustris]MBP3960508.1 hypothetical protein [Gemmata palustris]
MGLLKIKCPECNAGLKSAAGFTVGQTVCCPKCETYFAVEEPEAKFEEVITKPATGKSAGTTAGKKAVRAAAVDDDDEEDEKPRKKKRKRDDDDDEEGEHSYKNSPIRFVILGVLIVVMLVLAYFLYDKKRKENKDSEVTTKGNTSLDGGEVPLINPRMNNPNGVPPIQPIRPGLGGANPGPAVPPKAGGAGAGAGPIGDFAVGGTPTALAQVQALTKKHTAALLGAWTADLGGGATEEISYKADGTFTAKMLGPNAQTATGKYTVKAIVGTKGLKIQLEAGESPRTITVTFDGDELEHPSLQPGVTATFRKK